MKRKLIHHQMIQINIVKNNKQKKIVVVYKKMKYLILNGMIKQINKLLQIQLKFKLKLLLRVKNQLKKKDNYQN